MQTSVTPAATAAATLDFAEGPVLEDLVVPPSSVGRPGALRRPALLAVGLAAAVVGYGFLGRANQPVPPSPEPVVVGPVPCGSEPASGVQLDDPVAGEHQRGRDLRVSGRAGDEVRIVAALGPLTLGMDTVEPVEGRFETALPLVLPPGGQPVPIELRVTSIDHPDVTLACRPLRASAPSAVTLAGHVERSGDIGVVRLAGQAPLSSGAVNVRVGRRGCTSVDAVEVRVRAQLGTPAADAAAVFDVGEWSTAIAIDPGWPRAVVCVSTVPGAGSRGTTVATIHVPGPSTAGDFPPGRH